MTLISSLVAFFGANVFDNKPFIVTPYLKNGNVREYILKYPNSDFLRLVSVVLRCYNYF
jgi:hypothetical protein